MPIVRITLYEGRSLEVKRQLAARVTDAVSETLGINLQAVTVILDEAKKEDYAKGGVLVIDQQ